MGSGGHHTSDGRQGPRWRTVRVASLARACMLAATAHREGATAQGGPAPGFDAPQGPKKNQIQWTGLDSPGRKATPIFRGNPRGRTVARVGTKSARRGFDSRRLHFYTL